MDKNHLKDEVWGFLQAQEKPTSALTHTKHQCQILRAKQNLFQFNRPKWSLDMGKTGQQQDYKNCAEL